MRENLPVFPHRRVGFADAPALFPAVVIVEMLSWQRRVAALLAKGRPE